MKPRASLLVLVFAGCAGCGETGYALDIDVAEGCAGAASEMAPKARTAKAAIRIKFSFVTGGWDWPAFQPLTFQPWH